MPPRETPSKTGQGQGPPVSLPEGNPQTSSMDHSWTLQAVMQMQKDLGVLGEKIDRMRDDFGEIKADNKETSLKLIEVQKSIASAEGALKVFGRIYALALVIVAALLAWFLRPYPPPSTPPPNEITGVSSGTSRQLQRPQEEGAAEATPVVDENAPEGGSGR